VIKQYLKFYIGISFSLLVLIWSSAVIAEDEPIAVVSAENVYGDIARQIGGERVAVTSILNNPNQDPHLFEATPSTARQLAAAQIVVFNGAGYDPWIEKFLKTSPRANRIVINVAALRGINPGDNPHLWYDPTTMPQVARALRDAFSKSDPAHAPFFNIRLKTTLAALSLVTQRIEQMKAKYAGSPVTATEPIFNLMTNAIGLSMRNISFQMAMMNETEPSAREVAAFENDLKNGNVKVLIYNSQVSDILTERLRDIAVKEKIPVVGVTETMPSNTSFDAWVLSELDALDKALAYDARPSQIQSQIHDHH
jgi:zinc/manganese transport system substrate-binding protein